MHQYTNCYIAFLDILGFKKLIDVKTCEEIYNIFSTKMKNPLSGFSIGTKSVINMEDIKTKVMSDSICFFIDSQKRNALGVLIAICAEFQSELLRLSEPILSRGAIVRGDIYNAGDILFGPGFVKAYQMEEHNAKYPRIIITAETMASAKDNTDANFSNHINERTFLDYDEFITIDSLGLFEGFDMSGEDCRHLLSYINDVLGTSVDDSIREKYRYLKKNLLRWYKP